MGKLGKKARKFAKKNLQSVLKRKRKLNSMFKRKAAKNEQSAPEDPDEKKIEQPNERIHEVEDVNEVSLEAIFGEDDSDVADDDSESDGYLSEDSDCRFMAESEGEGYLKEDKNSGALSSHNKEIQLNLTKKKKKLDRLKEKDPGFSKFLESYDDSPRKFRYEDNYSDDVRTSNGIMECVNDNGSNSAEYKLLTSSAFISWCQLVTEQHSVPALICLLNGYRAACHFGNDSSGLLESGLCYGIEDSKIFCEILLFMLQKADSIFRGILGVSDTSCRKEKILELKNSTKWKTLKPLIKSYFRSTLFLLNQVTDSEILAFSLTRLRASIIFFAAYPYLLHRFIKIAIHLWTTGEGTLSSHAFLIIKDVATVFSSECYDTCLIKVYKSFIGNCRLVDPNLAKHIQFLRDSLVELCSLDVQRAYNRAAASIQQLCKILQLGQGTKKKEAVKRICSWQYTSCIDLWVSFISINIRDYDLQPLLYMTIQVINGVARLFPGPRYLPLRLKCIQWLNHLSSSNGIFIPVASLVLDILEYKLTKEGGKPGKELEVSSAMKLPKHWLKSRNFQEACVFSAIELLAVHFAQWSYHISFPELATIPVIRLRKFHDITTTESFRRAVKRLIDQVEQNVEFVRKRRDEVAFSPKDQQSVESFLQLEKCNGNAPFTHYYRSIIEKAASSNLIISEKLSSTKQKNSRRKHELASNVIGITVNGGVPKKQVAL